MLGAVPFLSPLYPHSDYGKELATIPYTSPSSPPKHRAHGSEEYNSSTAVGSVYKWHSAYGDTAPRTLSACGRGMGRA